MDDARQYQRYAVSDDGITDGQFEIAVDGELVRLVDFSVGGLHFISKVPFSPGVVNLLVTFKNRGEISLIGMVIRVKEVGGLWDIAIDLSKTYDLHTLRKV